MTQRTRKQHAHRARAQRHADARRDKRKAARAGKPTPRTPGSRNKKWLVQS